MNVEALLSASGKGLFGVVLLPVTAKAAHLMEQGDLMTAYCNGCFGDRNHFILYDHKVPWEEEISDDPPSRIFGEDRYTLLQCAGCNRICFRHESFHSEIYDEQGRSIPEVTYLPPREVRKQPNWIFMADLSIDKQAGDIHFRWMPRFVTRLLKEIYQALNTGCVSLAAMGTRALLETVMIDKVGDCGSFKNHVSAMVEEHFISKQQSLVLEATLDVGNAAMHRDYKPSKGEVSHALDIIENLIETLYITEAKAEILRKRVPPRGSRKK